MSCAKLSDQYELISIWPTWLHCSFMNPNIRRGMYLSHELAELNLTANNTIYIVVRR
jgi:hypothetical protein